MIEPRDRMNTWDIVPRSTLICSWCSREYEDGNRETAAYLLCPACTALTRPPNPTASRGDPEKAE